MKKLLILALLGLAGQSFANTVDIISGSGAAGSLGRQQTRAGNYNQVFNVPNDVDGNPDMMNVWHPSSVARAEFTTTITTAVFTVIGSTTVFGGVGLVDRVCVTSGTAGDYAVIYDSSPALVGNGANASIGALVGTELGGLGAIASVVTLSSSAWNAGGASASNGQMGFQAGQGCVTYNPPIPFGTGLYIQNSAAHIRTLVNYRLLRQ